MSTPLDLTFGVEIECIISFDPAKYESALANAEGILWEERVSKTLHRESKDMTSPGGDQEWTVTHDTSIDIKDGARAADGFLECDIEIKSPAMRFCPRGLRRVQSLIRVLTRTFDTSVNSSCGLHVHIGNQNMGFPLQTLKQFCVLTTMCEHQLNSLHPAHRVGNCHAKGPSAVFKGQHPWVTVRAIQSCKTKDELVKLYAGDGNPPDRCFAYNLRPMVSGPHKTIEFRQHEGTLDSAEIMNWIQVAGGLVDAAHEISAVDMVRLIDTDAFDPLYTIAHLLPRLRLEALRNYYEDHSYVHPRPEPIWTLGEVEGDAEVGSRRRLELDRWDELEQRHRIERLGVIARCQQLDRRHELERRRELERQDEKAAARMPVLDKQSMEYAVMADPILE